MPKLQYSLSQTERARGNLPELPVVNMFAESYPAEDSPILQSRPGLKNTGTTLGLGPTTAVFQTDGVLGGKFYAISAGALYENGVSKGTVVGTGPAKIMGFENRIWANAGGALYNWNGTTFATVATPGSFNVRSMCVGSSRLIVIDDTTGHFYWSDVLSTTIGALSFATAEYSPDNLVECLFIGDTLMLFGTETVESWPTSSANPALPWQPLVGRTFTVGCRGTGCACKFGPSFAWITNNNNVCVTDPQTIISNEGITERLAASSSAALWTFYLDGIEFLALTLDTETWVFNKKSSQWSTFTSNGHTNWIPNMYANGVFGSSIDGNLVKWATTYDDFGGILERTFRAGIPITEGTVPLMVVELKANTGRTPYVAPSPYADPTVKLRVSRDGGETWGAYKNLSLGTTALYRKNLRWTSLGYFGHPGLLVEITVTDPVPFRVSGLDANESLATI